MPKTHLVSIKHRNLDSSGLTEVTIGRENILENRHQEVFLILQQTKRVTLSRHSHHLQRELEFSWQLMMQNILQVKRRKVVDNKCWELNPEVVKEGIYSDPTQPKEKKKNKNKEKKDREAEDNMPLLAPEDQEKADGIILLLAFCAQGRAAAIETINQRLIPLNFAVEYCVRMIRKNKSFEPWLLFIAESYFNTESTTHPAVFSVQYSSNFWFILEVRSNIIILTPIISLTNDCDASTSSTC